MTDAPVRTVVQLVLINDTGDSYYRMRWPGEALAALDPQLRVINLAASARERLKWALEADLLVLFQSQDFDLIPILEERRRRGLKTLAEYNDNYYEPAPWSPVAEPWASPLVWQAYETIMSCSDGVLVTGEGLRELFSKTTRTPIHVLPNFFPRALPTFDDAYAKPTDTVNIGWAGSLGHMADILTWVPLLRSLVADYPQVRVHLMGNDTLPALFNFPPDRVRFRPWGTMDEYFDFWRDVHIGFAPLLDTPYNRCRSDVKALEMCASCVVPIVQNAQPYEEFIRATGAPHFSTAAELETHLRRFVTDVSLIRDAVEPCFNYVRKHRLEHSSMHRLELYRSLFPAEIAPVTPNGPALPAGPGYREIAGTTDQAAPGTAALNVIQQLWKEKRRSEAFALALKTLESNPRNPDVGIATLRIAALARHESFAPIFNRHVSLFPRDVRAFLVAIGATRDPAARINLWRTVVERVAAEPRSRELFREEILKQALHDVRRVPGFAPVFQALVQIYPGSPELRLILAEMLERQGQYREALAHFEWLLRSRALFEAGKRFFPTTDRGYLEAWVATLRARLITQQAKPPADIPQTP